MEHLPLRQRFRQHRHQNNGIQCPCTSLASTISWKENKNLEMSACLASGTKHKYFEAVLSFYAFF